MNVRLARIALVVLGAYLATRALRLDELAWNTDPQIRGLGLLAVAAIVGWGLQRYARNAQVPVPKLFKAFGLYTLLAIAGLVAASMLWATSVGQLGGITQAPQITTFDGMVIGTCGLLLAIAATKRN